MQFLRNKGAWYVETIRAWITPAAASGAVAKYLGLQSRWSVVVAIALPVIVEAAGYVIGRWLYNRGGVFADYQMAMQADPYKVRSIELLEAIRARLTDPAR
ncbi:MAG: hypothetical protein Q8S13_10100 [Dehalococcoidia bacterium]|nr:hypothetical protein [Dehalococcoidia bacterium]